MVLNIEEMNVNIFVIYSVMKIVNFVYRYVRVWLYEILFDFMEWSM